MAFFLIVKKYSSGQFCDLHFRGPIAMDVDQKLLTHCNHMKKCALPGPNELHGDFQCQFHSNSV